MSSVVFKEGIHINEIRRAIAKFHRQGIFSTLISDNGSTERYVPKDLELRELLVRAALMRKLSLGTGLRLSDLYGYISRDSELDPAGYLLKLSNSPDLLK